MIAGDRVVVWHDGNGGIFSFGTNGPLRFYRAVSPE
jgi:hypothetical protein